MMKKALSEMSDETLTNLANGRSDVQERELVFEEVFNRYQHMVFRCAYRMIKDQACAEDVTQEVFLRVARNLGANNSQGVFRGDSSLKTWIYSITLNTSKTALKRKIRESEKRHRFEQANRIEEVKDAAVDKDELFSCLSLGQRQVIVLWIEHDLSQKEIAQILGIPLATVSWRIFQAKKKMRNHFLDETTTSEKVVLGDTHE